LLILHYPFSKFSLLLSAFCLFNSQFSILNSQFNMVGLSAAIPRASRPLRRRSKARASPFAPPRSKPAPIIQKPDYTYIYIYVGATLAAALC
jgi:hypothetical protein